MTNPSGLCLCGCGQITNLAPKNRAETGWIKGQPQKYINHHGAGTPFMAKVAKGVDCWLWIGAKTKRLNGWYGVCADTYAHRKSHELFKGQIPKGFHIDHLCRNTLCVNPQHLEAVLPRTNVRRGKRTNLTIDAARQIRSRYIKGRGPYDPGNSKKLAIEFGVTQWVVQAIVKGINWRES